jgi:hypothetical protein
MKRAWLAAYSWDFVTAQNAMLCAAKRALHRTTSDGHEATRKMWEECHSQEMTLGEAVDICRRCHRGAPFCFYNGNTFAAIIRDVVGQIGLPPAKAAIARSLAGHIVAGVARAEEEQAFDKFCSELDRQDGSSIG